MDNQVFIDKKTFDIVIEPTVFNVDKKIAEVISILNKKGYLTKASCEGHPVLGGGQEYCDIDFLEDVQNDKRCLITNIREKDFDYISVNNIANIYILFNAYYEFGELPEGFDYHENCLSYITCRAKDGIVRTSDELDKDLEKYRNILKEWAKKLPDINERNDKNE